MLNKVNLNKGILKLFLYSNNHHYYKSHQIYDLGLERIPNFSQTLSITAEAILRLGLGSLP